MPPSQRRKTRDEVGEEPRLISGVGGGVGFCSTAGQEDEARRRDQSKAGEVLQEISSQRSVVLDSKADLHGLSEAAGEEKQETHAGKAKQ
ncbi:hypothetical protein NDU88_004348 [Pleurodeles waltl]|uniref:Uncharacterized protein n=1 Tax=Pleurodeles waltl TaxID=8319 RepID=A0AAV7LHS9_PLEWA|nr:hypothetical protein NDU88_004348 [Pleurodeles waltl]